MKNFKTYQEYLDFCTRIEGDNCDKCELDDFCNKFYHPILSDDEFILKYTQYCRKLKLEKLLK